MVGTVPGVTGSTETNVSAKDYVTVMRARQIAGDALGQYNVLRDQWLAAYDDRQKDTIENQMLVVLVQGHKDARDAVSAQAGAVGTDSADVFNLADYALEQYDGLRAEWQGTNDVNEQRRISNQMQTIMLEALQNIQKVQPNTYIVRSGDNLSMIAKRTLGDSNRWREIYDLNRDVIRNPNIIHPGAILNLPVR